MNSLGNTNNHDYRRVETRQKDTVNRSASNSVYQKISSLITVDFLAQASIGFFVCLGGYLILSGPSLGDRIDGLNLVIWGSALTLNLWGIASILMGKTVEGSQKLLLGSAIMVFSVANSRITQQRVQNARENSQEDLKTHLKTYQAQVGQLINTIDNLEDEKMMLKLQNDHAQNKLDSCIEDNYHFQPSNCVRGIVNASYPHPTPDYCRVGILEFKPSFPAKICKHITFGTTYVKGNELRDKISELTNQNHLKYAKRWNLNHRVVSISLLNNRCINPSDNMPVQCVPYWNKVAMLRYWLKEPTLKNREEWYIYADDDMPVTNMNINPAKAIDLLRRGKDTSLIVAQDAVLWKSRNPNLSFLSINTGLLFVRKDHKSQKLIEDLWEKRNEDSFRFTKPRECQTLGTCKNQAILHEQEGLARLVAANNTLINDVITVVKQRDLYEGKEIALNTFHRKGCFTDYDQPEKGEFCYSDPNASSWKPGDWMGQATGLPLRDKQNKAVREMKLKEMLDQVQE